MELKKKMFLLICFGAFLTNSVSMGTESEDLDKISKEYFQDLSRVEELGREKNLEGLDKLASELAEKWLTRNMEDYAYMMLDICGTFVSLDFKTDRQYDLGRKYAVLVLEKSANLEEKNQIPLEVEFSLLGHVQNVPKFKEAAQIKDWPNKRTATAKLYFHACHRLEKAIDKNWDPNDLSLVYPMPPAGVERGWDGMSPEVIKDPKLRAEYEAALEKYRRKSKHNTQQHNLRQLKKWHLPHLHKNLLWLYSGPLFDSTKLEKAALQEDLKRHIENKEVRATIFDGVEKKLLEKSKPKPKDNWRRSRTRRRSKTRRQG